MAEHPIENVMKTTMENLKEMIDVNTIVGDAVETQEGTVIIPISRVSFGFVAGGGEYKEGGNGRKNKAIGQDITQEDEGLPFAGGSGAGVSVNPIAFLVVGEDKIKLLPVQFGSTVDRLVELVPQMISEIQSTLSHRTQKNQQGAQQTQQLQQ
ncbi:MAG TPA: GerW family sporulation protein [Candidatus Atribacteria bacterium]|nr:GerW family sporulation protein [Candidatus Atribacteria bacterium]HPT77915.1 GerW family sporulation protein [Candidatus Atribacteria bacterium]